MLSDVRQRQRLLWQQIESVYFQNLPLFISYLSTLFPGVSRISHPSPAPFLFCWSFPGNFRNLYGPKLVIWIITSIFYSKVVQLPDPVRNSSPHTIDTIHISKHLWPQPGNLQPSCAVDFCAGKVRSSISGRNGRRRVDGAPAKKEKLWRTNLISCLEAM